MSAAGSSAWAERLHLALAQCDFGALRAHLLSAGEDDWLTSAWEGQQEPTLAQYARLAVHAGVPLTVLTGQVAPERTLAVALRAGLLDAPADVTADVERAHRLIDAARLLLSWFPARDADLASAAVTARRARSSLSFMKDAGKQAAQNLRTLWDLDDEDPVGDLVGLVEGLGVPVERRPLPEDVHGMTVHDESDARWTAVVFVSSADWWTRQRYTLAHELCHLLYRDSQPVIVDRDEEDSTELSEIRAEAFARHLLLPDAAVRGRVSRGYPSDLSLMADLVLSYGVSRTAVLKALQAVAQWSDDRRARVDADALSVSDLMAEAGRRDEWQAACAGQREPSSSGLLLDLALNAYRDQLVPLTLVADVLDRPADEVADELTAQGWAPVQELR